MNCTEILIVLYGKKVMNDNHSQKANLNLVGNSDNSTCNLLKTNACTYEHISSSETEELLPEINALLYNSINTDSQIQAFLRVT